MLDLHLSGVMLSLLLLSSVAKMSSFGPVSPLLRIGAAAPTAEEQRRVIDERVRQEKERFEQCVRDTEDDAGMCRDKISCVNIPRPLGDKEDPTRNYVTCASMPGIPGGGICQNKVCVTADLPSPAGVPLIMLGAASSRSDVSVQLQANVGQLDGLIRDLRFERQYPVLLTRPHCIVDLLVWPDTWRVYSATPIPLEDFHRVVVVEHKMILRWRDKNNTIIRMKPGSQRPHYLKVYETENEFCVLVKMPLRKYERKTKKRLLYK